MRNEIHGKFILKLTKLFQCGNQSKKFGIFKLLDFKKEQIQNLINKFSSLDLPKEIATEIYNQVMEFFSQYYNKGVLNSRIRYGQGVTSSFNNDEIDINWLNKDQYYVKSREYLTEKGKMVSVDYFIHKNLESFLKSELNIFIKNKILTTETLQSFKLEDLQEKFKKIEVFKGITLELIEYLTQFEKLQLELWYKKNLVLKTNYVISLDKIKKYAGTSYLDNIIKQILDNKEQLNEWSNLFGITINSKSELENMKKGQWEQLPVDTKYFNEEFKWNLISSLTQDHNLDDIIDGVLIKSDNFQALNLIMKKWGEKINLIYIDPPFNTGKKEFLYKNDYLISSWLTMMNNRLNLAKNILHENGNIFVRIDNNGNHFVRFLLNRVFGKLNFRNEIIINKTKAKKQRKKPFIQQTESLFFYSKSDRYFFNPLELPRMVPKWFELIDFPRSNKNPRTVLGKTFYPPKNRRWGLSQERIDEFEQKGKVRINKSKKYTDCFGNVIEEKPELYYDLEPVRNDWLDIPGYSQVHKFTTENSEELLQRVIECGSRENDIVLDFFLGSGTTVATAHKLNRKWIGIELENQFEDFIIPRMKTVAKGDKTGISKTLKTRNSGFFKYQYFENYEDTIENIQFDRQISKDILNFEKIEDPFNLTINIIENDQCIAKKVDIIETLNYLLGLYVEQIITSKNNRRTYIFVTGKIEKQKTVAIWRSTIELDLEQDKKFIEEHLNDVRYNYIYINGKSLIKNSRSIEMELKKLIWE